MFIWDATSCVAVQRKEGFRVLIFQQLHIHLAVLKLLLRYFTFIMLLVRVVQLLFLRFWHLLI